MADDFTVDILGRRGTTRGKASIAAGCRIMTKFRLMFPRLWRITVFAAVHITLGALSFALALSAYWLWWPTQPLATRIDDYAVTQSLRTPGTLVVHRSFVVHRDSIAAIYREVIKHDGKTLLTLPSVTRNYVKGTYSIDVYVPLPTLPAGRYDFVSALVYEENPLRQRVLPAERIVFEVIP